MSELLKEIHAHAAVWLLRQVLFFFLYQAESIFISAVSLGIFTSLAL